MILSEFVLQPRDSTNADTYVHREKVPSPIGEFSLECCVRNAARRPPDPRMLAALAALRDAFRADLAALVTLIYQQYLRATEDEEWCESWDVPTGLSAEELAPLLDCRTLTVSQQEIDDGDPYPGRVYLSPQWDQEHGLYVARQGNEWVLVDC